MVQARGIGCTQNGGPLLGLGTNVKYQLKFYLKIKYIFFQRTISVGLCGNINGSILDYARSIQIC